MTKIVFLTDTHIVAPGALLREVDTARHLALAVEEIAADHADATACLFMGDLVDDGAPDSYAHFRDLIEPLPVPVHLMIGNHDDRAAFRTACPTAAADEAGFIQFDVTLGGVRLIALDSAGDTGAPGELCAARLDWLAARLSVRSEGPLLVILHHHVHPLDMDVDRVPLGAPDAFADVLRGSATPVSMMLSGHVHRGAQGRWRGVPFATLAGTCWTTHYHQRARGDVATRSTRSVSYTVLGEEGGNLLLHTVGIDTGPIREVV